MLFCLTRSELDLNACLRDQMFRHRREEFYDRLGWDLEIDDHGREIDEYDGLNPLYVILTDRAGSHLASGRLLPCTRESIAGDVPQNGVRSEFDANGRAWELTRVFVARRDASSVSHAAALMWGAIYVGLMAGVHSFVSITPKLTTRLFTACGLKAQTFQNGVNDPGGEVLACQWMLSLHALDLLEHRAGRVLEGVAPPDPTSIPWSPTEPAMQNFAEVPARNSEPQHSD